MSPLSDWTIKQSHDRTWTDGQAVDVDLFAVCFHTVMFAHELLLSVNVTDLCRTLTADRLPDVSTASLLTMMKVRV